MKTTFLTVLSAAMASMAFAQSTASSVDIAAIETHFKNAQLVPQLLSTFSPSALLSVTFDNVGAIQPGQSLQQDQVKPTPSLAIVPANSSLDLSGKYTVAMVDADIVGTDEAGGQTRHWLVNGATITNNAVSTDGGLAVTGYAGPAPPSGSGAHRYVILVYRQPDSFQAPANLSTANLGVSKYNFPAYVQSTGLGSLIAANYFDVSVGAANTSVPTTSAVVSSTLSMTKTSSSTPAAGTNQSGNNGSSGAFKTSNPVGGLMIALAGAVSVLALF